VSGVHLTEFRKKAECQKHSHTVLKLYISLLILAIFKDKVHPNLSMYTDIVKFPWQPDNFRYGNHLLLIRIPRYSAHALYLCTPLASSL